MKSLGLVLLLAGLASAAMANGVATPEIGPASAAGALTLLSGTILVIRGRRKK